MPSPSMGWMRRCSAGEAAHPVVPGCNQLAPIAPNTTNSSSRDSFPFATSFLKTIVYRFPTVRTLARTAPARSANNVLTRFTHHHRIGSAFVATDGAGYRHSVFTRVGGIMRTIAVAAHRHAIGQAFCADVEDGALAVGHHPTDGDSAILVITIAGVADGEDNHALAHRKLRSTDRAVISAARGSG